MSIEFSETYIGECSRSCTKPATVRIHKDWVVCALHYFEHEITEEVNDAGLAVALLKPWRDEAESHGLDFLVEALDRIADEAKTVRGLAHERRKKFIQVEREADPSHERKMRSGGRQT